MDPDSDPDLDPAIFIIDLQDANKKTNLKKKIFCILLFEGTLASFFKDIKSKRSHKTVGIKVFKLFLLMIEGSGSGSISLTNGSGSRRPKNTWIRWIRIRISNTDSNKRKRASFYVLTFLRRFRKQILTYRKVVLSQPYSNGLKQAEIKKKL